jgi:hypothetical protein
MDKSESTSSLTVMAGKDTHMDSSASCGTEDDDASLDDSVVSSVRSIQELISVTHSKCGMMVGDG